MDHVGQKNPLSSWTIFPQERKKNSCQIRRKKRNSEEKFWPKLKEYYLCCTVSVTSEMQWLWVRDFHQAKITGSNISSLVHQCLGYTKMPVGSL